MSNSRKEQESHNFDQVASEWNQQMPEKSLICADELVRRLQIRNNHSLLDVAAGTGIIYSRLLHNKVTPQRYAAIDISQKMLDELKASFSDVETVCADFEEEFSLNQEFDFVVIYNSIPHFENLDQVFENACNNLKQGGTFAIMHARSRQQLKEHHERIGHVSSFEPIPSDSRLLDLSGKVGFEIVFIEDDDYFCYVGQRRNRIR